MVRYDNHFTNSSESGKEWGYRSCIALTKLTKFVIFNCVVNPISHAHHFIAGFKDGMKEGSNFAKYH